MRKPKRRGRPPARRLSKTESRQFRVELKKALRQAGLTQRDVSLGLHKDDRWLANEVTRAKGIQLSVAELIVDWLSTWVKDNWRDQNEQDRAVGRPFDML